MKKRTIRTTCAAAAAIVLAAAAARAADEELPPVRGPFSKILLVDFDGDIEALMAAYVSRRLERAEAEGFDCVVLRIDSPGGTVFHSKEIGDAVLALPESIHTIAWVPKMALSGAAFAALACDEIAMKPGATLGDAQPILGGAPGTKIVSAGEKLESPLRAWFTNYAQKNGYPVLLAQAMVSERMEVIRVRPKKGGKTFFMEGDEYRKASDDAELFPGLRKADLVQVGTTVVGDEELLTMTAEQALDYGFVARRHENGLFPDEETFLAALKAPGAVVEETRMSFSESASKWLLTIAGILSAVVVMAIMVFMWQGPGLMSIVGIVALILVVLINLTADQLHGFPIFLILIGVGLLAVEVFVFPGFGVPGLLGIASMAAGFLFLATGSTLGDTGALDSEALVGFGLQFVFTAIVVLGLLLLMSRFVPRVGPARRMVLQPSGVPASDGLAASTVPAIGTVGRSLSPLRPAGSADFSGVLTDVVSDGGFIPQGAAVEVIAVEGERVTVQVHAPSPTSGHDRGAGEAGA